MDFLISQLASEFSIKESQVKDTLALIDEGNTIPFIARYRKEVTGNLSDVVLRDLNTRLLYLRKLEKRKEEIRTNIEEQGKMTPELAKAITAAATLQEVEDLYLPYKQKKKTRASVAREKGLEPLAEMIMAQGSTQAEIEGAATEYIDAEKGVETSEEALQGAMDIIAETVSDNADYRKWIRREVWERGEIISSVTKDFAEEKTEFENYYSHQEPVKKIANHRVLALNRGEKRKVLSVKIASPDENVIGYLLKKAAKKNPTSYLTAAIEDGYKRLIAPSIEREIRAELKEKAEESAIKMFALNLKKLLLQPPFKDRVTLGFDPAYRTGCKLAVLSATGELLATGTIYPTKPKHDVAGSRKVILGLIEKYKIDIIAIGNGTASRESEQFIAETLKECPRKVQYIVVNEAGASVYSASELAQEEYPEINVSIRGAISIAGRLQDPLSELVKIDPKHIGVGQYQHDVNQKALETVLDETVEDAVNNVGVNINRASVALLKYVSGINKTVAKNIIDHRAANGKFASRKQIKDVKGLGAKAFEQCAGFLRIDDGDNILDNTGVHPESYKATEKLLAMAGLSKSDLASENRGETIQKLNALNLKAAAQALELGEPTIMDIVKELKKPGLDPRDSAPKPHLKSDVMTMEDLSEGMELTGTVRNVIDFGAFVDIGVHQDGLVHISQISDRYISHPSDVLAVGDVVTVKVLTIDLERNRIGLSMLV